MFTLATAIVMGVPWALIPVISIKVEALVVLSVITVNKNLGTLEYWVLPDSRHDVVDVNKVEPESFREQICS